MPDPRVTKLAQVLVNYSLDLQPGEEMSLNVGPGSEELGLAAYKEAVLVGAHVFVQGGLAGAEEIFYKDAADTQLDYVSPVTRLIAERFTALLNLRSFHNTRELSGVDPTRQSRVRKANSEIMEIFMERAARKELKWCLTVFPTNASAQEADMSLSEYEDFVYAAGLIDLPDPVAEWEKEGERQRVLIDWLSGKDQVSIRGSNIDMRLSIKERPFIECSGCLLYTSPSPRD